MTFLRGLRATIVVAAAMGLMGCASVKSIFSDHAMSDRNTAAAPVPDVAASAAAAAAGGDRAEYRLEVQAPDPLRALLLDYLDLSRFQNAPATDRINAAELERLIRAVPAQARGLLETEGYFNAQVTVQHATSDSAVPLLRVVVDPGPRAVVGKYSVEATGDLQKAEAAGDKGALREMEALRTQWPLHTGDAFRDVTWANAKNQTIARIRADGYASAVWSSTNARVDAPENHVDVAVVIDSGPLYHLGEMHIEGLSRYDENSVRKLSTFGPGQPYNEKTLLDFQERLQKVGLFEGASVTIDPDPKTATAAPVIIRVKEMQLQQATVGVGYSANTGPRVTLEHTHRDVFGTHWIATNKFEVGPDLQTWSGELTSHPLDGLYRDLIAGSTSRLKADDQVLLSSSARIGRAQDTTRIERLYYAEYIHTRLDSDLLTNQADAVSVNYNWIYRDIDNVLLPTLGYTASLQGGFGFAHGTQTLLGEPQQESSGPFTRLYGRLTFYQPLG
jgi:translocation and assembly module TamA